jgi:type IV pilus assembly protein PilV
MNAPSRGFTLLETLVALVLLSMGLLGAWALLLGSFRAHTEARHHALATGLVRDMADRIRANPQARALYMSENPAPDEVACETAQVCDVTQRAAADLAQFVRAARSLLPGADTAIEYEPALGAASADRYAITLRWHGVRDIEAVTLNLLAAPVAGEAPAW